MAKYHKLGSLATEMNHLVAKILALCLMPSRNTESESGGDGRMALFLCQALGEDTAG